MKINIDNEAIGLLDFHGGDVPDSIELSRRYFENREIPQADWQSIHTLALQYQTNP